jgi:DNA-binding response OmpR family regulator
MNPSRHILVVVRTSKLAAKLTEWLCGAGYDVEVVGTFAAGKRQLDDVPDLLLSELKLGEYNGLHLALRAKIAGIAAVVIGPRDAVIAREAASLGATYLGPPRHRQALLERVDRLLQSCPVKLGGDPRVPYTPAAAYSPHVH